MNMSTLTNRQEKIVDILRKQNDYCTADFIAQKTGVSIRTIKTEIQNINLVKYETQVEILSRPRLGYCVKIVMDSKKECTENDADQLITLPVNTQERIEYVTKKLLVLDYHIKKEVLADELYISSNSLSQVLTGVRARIGRYRLKLVSRANYGVIIEGTETDKRLAISEFFFHENKNRSFSSKFRQMYGEEEHEEIISVVKKTCRKYRIEISDFSLHNMAIHISILMRRVQFYNYVIADKGIMNSVKDSVEFKAASEIIQYIEMKHHYLLPIGETVYTAQHIIYKRVSVPEKHTIEADSRLKTCLQIMFSEINNNFGLNLTNDDDLYQYLYQHIPPMIMRLISHMTIRNPLVIENKRKYLFATKVTHSACKIIDQYYHVEVDDNEFGYLLLYFNLSIMKFEADKHISIGVLTTGERAEMLTYSNEIKDYFSSGKYEIVEVNKLSRKTADIFVSTRNVNDDFHQPLYIISNDDYLWEIDRKLELMRYSVGVDEYVKPEYCCFNLAGDTKDQVMNEFYKMLQKKKIIKRTPAFYERLEYDELGNGIVHFQDTSRIIHKNLLFITVLQKPVYWDRGSARVLIITKTRKDNDSELYNLCRLVSKWLNNRNCVDRLIKRQNYLELYTDLIEGGNDARSLES